MSLISIMVPYDLFDVISDSVGFVSTAIIVVKLITGLRPRFKTIRDSCRAGQLPEGRARLLWSSFLVPVVWQLAAILYFRNLFSLWDMMGSWLEDQPVNRPVYAFLHLYLFFLLLCGFYAFAVTIFEICWNREVLGDLLMIARFRTNGYHLVEDTEAQHGSSAPDRSSLESEPAGVVDVRNASSPPHGEGLRSNGQGFREDVAPTTARTMESRYPAQEAEWSGSDYPIYQSTTWAVERPLWLVDANTL